MTVTKQLLAAEFYAILIEQGLDNFTVMQLRDALMVRLGVDGCAAQREQHRRAYRLVMRLLNARLLEKQKEPAAHARYCKTPLFSKIGFSKKRAQSAELFPLVANTRPGENVNEEIRIKEKLQALVKTYQVDLLASIGESEEYMRLHEHFPELKARLEPRYHLSREKSSKILGHIKAVENILAELPDHRPI